MPAKNIVILGSTGSIGVNALDVVRRYRRDFNVIGLAANSNVERVIEQAKEFRPAVVAMGDSASAEKLRSIFGGWRQKPEVWNHHDGVERLAAHQRSELVLCGMVGAQGLKPLVAALKAG